MQTEQFFLLPHVFFFLLYLDCNELNVESKMFRFTLVMYMILLYLDCNELNVESKMFRFTLVMYMILRSKKIKEKVYRHTCSFFIIS